MKKIIIFLIFAAMYGIFDAMKDTLAHHYSISIFSKYNPNWFDANLSWCNKWDNCTPGKENFLFSSTFFVFLTDAWHFLKMLLNIIINFPVSYLIARYINFELLNRFNKFTKIAIIYIALLTTQLIFFNLFYHYLLLAK